MVKSIRKFANLPGKCLLILILLSVAGCSDSKALVSIKGKINVKGQPAAGAVVLFHPDSNPIGLTASGVADETGVYTLSSGLDKGVAPGKYIVTVTWPDPTVKSTPEQMMQGMIEDAPDLLEGAYATRSVSKLTAEVPTTSGEIPPFELDIP
jgi:hypothetical protein